VKVIERQYRRGLVSEDERYKQIISIWEKTTEQVTSDLMKGLDVFNPIFMMATSGARGSINQIRQLGGMRGLMANPSGMIIEAPIRSNFREGLMVPEKVWRILRLEPRTLGILQEGLLM
jgi:DNA-directed RNA polymerase subunit beta'